MSTMIATRRFESASCSVDDVSCTATRHTHADEETAACPSVVIPRRGTFRWHYAGTSVVAEPNTVLLFDPDRPHRITHPTDDGDDCTAVRFAPEHLDEAFGRNAPRHWILDGDSHVAFRLAMHRLRNADDALEGEESAMTMLRILARSEEQRSSPHRAVDALRELLASNPGDRATLSELARELGLSPFELARRFRRATGSSIHQYRLRLRILVALERLEAGQDDITMLALELGFASHAHFTSTFTRTLNAPPRRFRA